MPKPATINWTLAKVLRGQGLGWSDIAPQVGAKPATLMVRASREGWNNIKEETAKALQDFGFRQSAEVIRESAPKAAEAWLDKVQKNTLKAADAFDNLPLPKTLHDFKTYEETADKHVKRGRAAFGLDDQKGGGVQVNIMSQLTQIAATANTANTNANTLAQDCVVVEEADSQGVCESIKDK